MTLPCRIVCAFPHDLQGCQRPNCSNSGRHRTIVRSSCRTTDCMMSERTGGTVSAPGRQGGATCCGCNFRALLDNVMVASTYRHPRIRSSCITHWSAQSHMSSTPPPILRISTLSSPIPTSRHDRSKPACVVRQSSHTVFCHTRGRSAPYRIPHIHSCAFTPSGHDTHTQIPSQQLAPT